MFSCLHHNPSANWTYAPIADRRRSGANSSQIQFPPRTFQLAKRETTTAEYYVAHINRYIHIPTIQNTHTYHILLLGADAWKLDFWRAYKLLTWARRWISINHIIIHVVLVSRMIVFDAFTYAVIMRRKIRRNVAWYAFIYSWRTITAYVFNG